MDFTLIIIIVLLFITVVSLVVSLRSIAQVGRMNATLCSRLDHMDTQVLNQIGQMDTRVTDQFSQMRSENQQNAEQMRTTVNTELHEQLKASLELSFERVHKELEGMHTLSQDVGNIRTLLGGTKTRGTMGEVQLKAILHDILPEHLVRDNVHPLEGSRAVVECAVKLPSDEDQQCWLPIDAKFFKETYEHLMLAKQSGDKQAIDAATKRFATAVKTQAAEITKYINPPATPNFAIMFVPLEGMYAEIVSIEDLLTTLQHDFHVVVAGPSTLAAIVNSILLAHQSLALEQHTAEAIQAIEEFKKELPHYTDSLDSALTTLRKTEQTLEETIGTRTRVIKRKLDNLHFAA